MNTAESTPIHGVPTCLPPWSVGNLPAPMPLSWRNWTAFIGPGIVMMGIQIGGGEWLFGPEVTARYGGGLMWIATIAILAQVFYNLECGRYALYCGEPIMTGFMRLRPGPGFWMGLVLLLNFSALIPGLSTHGAAVLASLVLGHPAGVQDRALVTVLAYVCLFAVALPVLVGGKVYTTMQAVMTVKVIFVLGFCLVIGLFFVDSEGWIAIFSGFLKFGQVPVTDGPNGEQLANVFGYYLTHGEWPVIALSNIAVLGAFAGYAGGGGLSNSTYSNFVRDKGWGMGAEVGAIPSAVGGRNVTLSHLGKVFPLTAENLNRWKSWWRHIFTDQVFIWAPGCVMGMALPALLSIGFAQHSELQRETVRLDWAQAVITADGMRHAPGLSTGLAQALWVITLLVGLMVLLPSQMSIVDDFSRRWTDILWSGHRRVRERMRSDQVKYIYYAILSGYVLWSFVCAGLFTNYGHPKLMVLVIANMNNLTLGITSFLLLRVNHRLLPLELRPRWYHSAGLAFCGVFYLGLAALVFFTKQLPMILEMLK